MRTRNLSLGPALAIWALITTGFVAWLTHIVACLSIMFSVGATTAQVIAAGLLILIGALVIPPVAIIHGVMIWFGFGWF
jgi:hypothetical protein